MRRIVTWKDCGFIEKLVEYSVAELSAFQPLISALHTTTVDCLHLQLSHANIALTKHNSSDDTLECGPITGGETGTQLQP